MRGASGRKDSRRVAKIMLLDVLIISRDSRVGLRVGSRPHVKPEDA